jgi:cytochrome c556
MKKLAAAALATLLMAPAVAQEVRPDQAINFRKGVMQVIQWHFLPMVQMIKGERPFDAALYARNVAMIETMSRLVPEGFTPGSDKAPAGMTTRALPVVWGDPAKFKTAVQRFQDEAAKTAAIAKAGDEKAMRAQVSMLAKTCAGCHEDFRAK